MKKISQGRKSGRTLYKTNKKIQEELAINIRNMLRYKKMNPYYLIAIKVEMPSQIVRQVKMKKKL